jgi:uncharacterized membrane protein
MREEEIQNKKKQKRRRELDLGSKVVQKEERNRRIIRKERVNMDENKDKRNQAEEKMINEAREQIIIITLLIFICLHSLHLC